MKTFDEIFKYIKEEIINSNDLLNLIEEKSKLENINLIDGGLAQNKTINDIIQLHNTTKEQMYEQLQMGIDVELEHTKNKLIAMEIAMDHLVEDKEYYTKLKTLNL